MLVLSEMFNSNGGDKHFLSFRMLVNVLSKAILSDRYRLWQDYFSKFTRDLEMRLRFQNS